MRIAPQYPVGSRFEARHIPGDELGPDRDGAVVQLKLHPACKAQVHPQRRDAGDRLHAVGTAAPGIDPPALRVVHVNPRVRRKAQAQSRPAGAARRVRLARSGFRRHRGRGRQRAGRGCGRTGPGGRCTCGHFGCRGRARNGAAGRTGHLVPTRTGGGAGLGRIRHLVRRFGRGLGLRLRHRQAIGLCAARGAAGRHRGALVPGAPPKNTTDQQRDQRGGCELRPRQVFGRGSGRQPDTRRRNCSRGRGRRVGSEGGENVSGGQSQNTRVFLQMPFRIHRRTNALIIVRLERFDHPRVEMHFVGCFLRAHAAPLTLRLEPLAGRESLRAFAHRSTPERMVCACSEFGNSVSTRRA